MKFNKGDVVLVEFFDALKNLESVGKKKCLVDSFMEELTNLKNDGEEYYRIFIDCDKEKPFFSNTKNMERIWLQHYYYN